MSVLSIATSGLSAASLRLNVAASNIANVLTTGPLPATGGTGASGGGAGSSNNNAGSSNNNSNFPAAFVPLRVNQVDQTNGSTPGGTVATVSTVSPSFVAQSDPSAPFANQDGLVAAPNIDIANEFVQLLTARESFAANAKVIQAFNNTTKALLDIKV
jgi:flagellar basal-body rod protein FlgC